MMKASGGGQRKRKRQEEIHRLKQQGIDLPDIPGLPVPVIPLHVHALKKTTKFFSLVSDAVVQPWRIIDRNEATPATSTLETNNVLDNLLDRVHQESSTATNDNDEAQRQRRESETAKDAAITSWLEAIHRAMRDGGSSKKGLLSIPLAAIQHIFECTQQHESSSSSTSPKRVSVKRAGLHLAAQLLNKSADCRKWLLDTEESKVLMKWMDRVAGFTSTSDASSTVTAAVRHYQREAFLLLQALQTQGYSDLYPSLPVALQRFRQVCSVACDETSCQSSETASMATWRRARDQALQFHEKELAAVTKLIKRAHTCMDVLVPKLSGGSIPHDDGDSDGHESDEDDIDWEDGGGEDENDSGTLFQESGAMSHEDAVDRTMAAMESTGGLASGGMEIRLGHDGSLTGHQTIEHLDDSKRLAIEKLTKCVEKLSVRHMPRLTAWVEGLTNADNLVLVNGNSLVSMPLANVQKRRQILQQVMDSKQTLASVLASSKKLGVEFVSDAAPRTTAVTTSASSVRELALASQQRRANLSLSMKKVQGRSKRTTHSRSNRIKIKFGKR